MRHSLHAASPPQYPGYTFAVSMRWNQFGYDFGTFCPQGGHGTQPGAEAAGADAPGQG